MISESCAITCRVAPSFMRIGHLDLFARRAAGPNATQQAQVEHEMIVKHAIAREFSDVLPDAPLPERAIAVFEAACARIATMIADWLRVGFCQGNFNCDNCLVGGRTMDYGPFGFIDKYDPHFAKWVGSGDHFAFMSQPGAGLANLGTLATALKPLLSAEEKKDLDSKLRAAKTIMSSTTQKMWCEKLGLASSEEGFAIFQALEELMQRGQVDFTILFRQLAELPSRGPDASDLLEPLREAFYKPPGNNLEAEWISWLQRWVKQVDKEGSAATAKKRMNAVNPKYILREYMLVEAYEAAKSGDDSVVHELYQLVRKPYEEQPELENKYYRRAPDEALSRNGCAVMT